MYCVPDDSKGCPITQVTFKTNSDGKLEVESSTDPFHGLPIIDLKLSQGGSPCFSEEGFNSQHIEKQKNGKPFSKIMGRQFDQECPTVMNNKTPLKDDPFWKKLSGLPEELRVSEWQLQEENDRGWRIRIQNALPK